MDGGVVYFYENEFLGAGWGKKKGSQQCEPFSRTGRDRTKVQTLLIFKDLIFRSRLMVAVVPEIAVPLQKRTSSNGMIQRYDTYPV
jgi:hypothetical protein